MAMPLPGPEAERDLLFGFLAVKQKHLTAAQLQEILSIDPSSGLGSLADYLAEKGLLGMEERQILEQLLAQEVQHHAGDLKACLESVVLELGDAGLEALVAGGTVRGLPLPPAIQDSGYLSSGSTSTTVEGTDNSGRKKKMAGGPCTSLPATGDRYELVKVHGRGGMGLVWLAKDSVLKRSVAFKELREERQGDASTAGHFLREAWIQGLLEHPGVVPIYDLGSNPAGQPFYTMRFIQGRTLSQAVADYHAQRQQGKDDPLRFQSLLQAFITVCNTLAFAHTRGVLHRDLKGVNVMLGEFGEVMVLDWGLAKFIGEAETIPKEFKFPGQGPDWLSTPGQILGTPAFMAPEQAKGLLDQIDQRTDIYGLGAILFEILTGQAPHRGKDLEELLTKIRQGPTPRARVVNPQIPAALDAIAARAMAHAPGNRFQEAGELAREVQRYLADEPVHCHREGWWARLGRWARHHRSAVTGAAAALIVAVVGLAATTWLVGREQIRTEQAHQRARTNFRKARDAVDRFFVQVSENRLLNEAGMQPLRRELLQTAGSYYETFLQETSDDPEVRADLAQTFFQLAKVQNDLGDAQASLQSIGQAVDRYAELHQQFPDQTLYMAGLGKSHLRKGALLHGGNQLDTAEIEYLTARDLLDRLTKEAIDTGEAVKPLSQCYLNLGVIYRTRNKFDEALKMNQQALSLQESLARDNPADASLQDELAATHTNIGVLLDGHGHNDGAEKHMRKALEIHQNLIQAHPEVIEYQRNLAKSWNNVGKLLRDRADPQGGEAYLKALKLREQIAEASPNVPSYQAELADIHQNLGDYFELWRQKTRGTPAYADLFSKAKDQYQEAYKIYANLRARYPGQREYSTGLLHVASSLGDLHIDDDKKVSEKWYQEAVNLGEKLFTQDYRTALVNHSLSNAYWGQAEIHGTDFTRSLPCWKRALEVCEARNKSIVDGAVKALERAEQDGFLATPAGKEIFNSFQGCVPFWNRAEIQALKKRLQERK